MKGWPFPKPAPSQVQHHPEAGPGPHDSWYLFDRFSKAMGGRRISELTDDPTGLPAPDLGVGVA